MGRGAWQTTVHEFAQLDMTEQLTHTHTHTHTHTLRQSSQQRPSIIDFKQTQMLWLKKQKGCDEQY